MENQSELDIEKAQAECIQLLAARNRLRQSVKNLLIANEVDSDSERRYAFTSTLTSKLD